MVKTPTFSLVYKYLSSETLERFSISECGFISLPCIFAGWLVLITAQPVKKWATLCGSTGLGNSPGVLREWRPILGICSHHWVQSCMCILVSCLRKRCLFLWPSHSPMYKHGAWWTFVKFMNRSHDKHFKPEVLKFPSTCFSWNFSIFHVSNWVFLF